MKLPSSNNITLPSIYGYDLTAISGHIQTSIKRPDLSNVWPLFRTLLHVNDFFKFIEAFLNSLIIDGLRFLVIILFQQINFFYYKKVAYACLYIVL